MTLVDRYVLAIFLRTFVICFISVSGMFIMGDFVGHIAEFVQSAGTESLVSVVWDFYAARLPWLFDILGKVVILVAAAFTITWMQRNNELTALMAAGISRWRVLRPVLLAAIVLSVLAGVSRELVLPHLRDSLGREARNLNGDALRTVSPLRDLFSDILIGGRHTISKDRRIVQPNFILPSNMSAYGTRILTNYGLYMEAEAHHPAGYWLSEVLEPQQIDQLPSYSINGKPVIMTRRDYPWLQPQTCFVATELPFELLDGGADWRKMAGTPELLRGLANPSLDFGAAELLTVHARVVQPLLDVTLLMLGLPLIMSRGSRGIFVSIGSALLMVAAYYIGVALSHTMGLNLFLSPMMAAWLPLFVFVPLAAWLADPLFA